MEYLEQIVHLNQQTIHVAPVVIMERRVVQVDFLTFLGEGRGGEDTSDRRLTYLRLQYMLEHLFGIHCFFTGF